MLGILVLILVLLGGVLFAAKLAREQGGREIGWALTTLVAGGLGYALGSYLLVLAFSLESKLALLAAFAGPALSVFFEGLAIFCLFQLAKGDLGLRGKRWPIYRLASEGAEAYHGQLRLPAGELVLEPESGAPLALPYHTLTGCEVDGECLRLTWAAGEALLQPGANHLSSEARTRLCEALCRTIERRRLSGPR